MSYFLSWVKNLCGVFFVFLTLLASPLCHASDGFYSEMSHAIGGAAMASYITYKYSDSEYRSWIGFGLSTAIGVVAQNYEISKLDINRIYRYLDKFTNENAEGIEDDVVVDDENICEEINCE